MEAAMRQFIDCVIVLVVVPMTMLGSAGRPGFLGYYLGILTMWLVFVLAASSDPAASRS
jgi:hypothetical protein